MSDIQGTNANGEVSEIPPDIQAPPEHKGPCIGGPFDGVEVEDARPITYLSLPAIDGADDGGGRAKSYASEIRIPYYQSAIWNIPRTVPI